MLTLHFSVTLIGILYHIEDIGVSSSLVIKCLCHKRFVIFDFPAGALIGVSCQSREHGFDPWSGKTARATEQLSPCATAT